MEKESIWAGFAFPLCVAAVLICAVVIVQALDLRHRVTVLEHACIPVDTGGGVTQCLQPNVSQVHPH